VWQNCRVALSVIATKEHISSGSNDGKSRQPFRPACELPHKRGGGTADIVLWRQHVAAIRMTVTTQEDQMLLSLMESCTNYMDRIGPYIKGVTPCITHNNQLI